MNLWKRCETREDLSIWDTSPRLHLWCRPQRQHLTAPGSRLGHHSPPRRASPARPISWRPSRWQIGLPHWEPETKLGFSVKLHLRSSGLPSLSPFTVNCHSGTLFKMLYIYVYINIQYMCVCACIYIYTNPLLDWPTWPRWAPNKLEGSGNQMSPRLILKNDQKWVLLQLVWQKMDD